MPRLSLALALGGVLVGCHGPDDGFNIYNVPPAVTISEPMDETTYNEGETIVFRGLVDDEGDVEDLNIEWLSTLQELPDAGSPPDAGGNVEFIIASLMPGDHVITLRATDLYDGVGEAYVTVHVEGIPDIPDLTVVHPIAGEQGLEGAPYRFEVLVNDEQDEPETLLVSLESNNHAGNHICYMTPDFNGVAYCEDTLELGEHLLTFRVEDSDGFTAQKQVVFFVVARADYDADGDTYSPNQGDCDDSDITTYPGAPEWCDGKDNDCNPSTPAEVGSDCYDDDGDGYCESPPCINASGSSSDCNDANNQIYPGRTESCNNIDDDCDTIVDEGTSCYDDDGDGFCESPPCINANGTQYDCDDSNRDVKPGAQEKCTTPYDDDCDGLTNEQNALGCTQYYVDNDGDLYYRSGAQSQCWCDGGSGLYTGIYPNDCYDQNALAHPGQTGWFTGQRGDGSFDYNCYNGNERQYTTTAYCAASTFSCNGTSGWKNMVPQCGMTGQYQSDCDFDLGALLLGCGAPCAIACFAGTTTNCWQCIAGACPGSMACDISYSSSITTQACH